jgi:hypothetical protein
VIDELYRRGFDARLAQSFRRENNVLIVSTAQTLKSIRVRTVHFSPWYVHRSIFADTLADEITVYVLLWIEEGACVRFFLAKNRELRSIFRQPENWVAFGFIDVEAMKIYEDNWDVLKA